MGRIVLSGRGRKRLLGGHPWVYADDVHTGEGERGELVPVLAPDESSLGWGLFSSHSKIAVRLVTRASEQPDRAFWTDRIRSALAARERCGYLDPAGAGRLLAGDADGLPGFVLDRYADVLVMQSGCQGSDRMREFLLELVEEALPFPVAGVLDRSDSSVRRHEDLESRVEWVRGERSDAVVVVEAERSGVPRLEYEVSLLDGHKTGAYLDQRENRARAARLARGGRVLDAFSYDGLFGIRAALAGATSVLCVDQSADAGERLMRNAERNGVADRVRFERGNAMHVLRDLASSDDRYDLVVVDPPAFARTKREAEGALRGYRELNRRAMKLVARDGVLVTASCSHNVGREAFLGCLSAAAHQAAVRARLTGFHGASPDHPVSPSLPESEYLKCAFLALGR